MKPLIVLFALLLVPITAVPTIAAQVRVFMGEINITGAHNRDELKTTMQTLLASRLSGDRVTVVGNVAGADAVISATYISIGKMFSIDAVATPTAVGNTVIRAFVQGDTQDELIPAVGKLAEKLTTELVKSSHTAQQITADTTVASAAKTNVMTAATGDFIKPRELEKGAANGWISQRLNGAATLIAVGTILKDGSRDIFLAEERRLAYYRQEKEMKLVAEMELKPADKIISLDTITGGDGSLDIYLTIIRSGELSSQVWRVKGDSLVMVAEKLPYYFRSTALSGGAKKLYAQSMGRDDDFFGEVAEATRVGATINLKNPLKMPRFGTIYSFNQFRDRDGKTFTAVINPDGYVIVYDEQLKELWRSNDKFGGSELFFQKEDDANQRVSGDRFRWIFQNQRIQVTSKGELLVGKNDGFWVLGNARSYKRGAVYCLTWNGSSLEEKWRTRETQNYMPDYFFDETRNELLFLQTVQRPGISNRGASSLSIKKVE
ncbi:MAG: VCBS repeat-containing protein [Desulfuromonadaceae bacterium]|nr:VCBS repeat-containing protein [Desulfuromonadaceae bacterium]